MAQAMTRAAFRCVVRGLAIEERPEQAFRPTLETVREWATKYVRPGKPVEIYRQSEELVEIVKV